MSMEELIQRKIAEADICARLRSWDCSHVTDRDALRRDREAREAADEIERLRTLVSWMDKKPESRAAQFWALQGRLHDCETSLNIFDEGQVSEYWMRHGSDTTSPPVGGSSPIHNIDERG